MFIRWPGTILPSTTTGTCLIEPIARIAACGGLMIGDELLDIEHAEVGDREGAALVLLRLQAAGAGAADQILRHPGDGAQALLVGVGDEGGDQPALDRDGDVKVDVGVVVQCVAWNEVLRFGKSRSARAAALTIRSLNETFEASSSTWALICERKAAAGAMSTSTVT